MFPEPQLEVMLFIFVFRVQCSIRYSDFFSLHTLPRETIALLCAAFITLNTTVASTRARWIKLNFRAQVAIRNCGVGEDRQNLLERLE